MTSYTPVTALIRGLKILQCLNEHGPQSVGDLYQRTGIAKPTVVRMLETLKHAGYVDIQNPHRLYCVTARVLELSNGYDVSTHLLNIALPYINQARQDLGWPIELGVFVQDAMTILDTSRPTGAFSINRKPGSRVPVLRTALGKAYLAFLPEAELLSVIEKLAHYPDADYDFARRPDTLMEEMRHIRTKGYALSDRATLTNGRALATPIMQGKTPVASINIVVHTSALSQQQLEEQIGPEMLDLSNKISQAIS